MEKFRHPWVTVFELVIPAFLASMLLIGRVQVEPEKIPNITYWGEFEVGNLQDNGQPNPSWSATNQPVCGGLFKDEPVYLAYSPISDRTTTFMTELKDILVNEDNTVFGTKAVINKACWFTGARNFEIKV